MSFPSNNSQHQLNSLNVKVAPHIETSQLKDMENYELISIISLKMLKKVLYKFH